MSEQWTITALEMMQAMIATLNDNVPESCDALFLHGAPASESQKRFSEKLLGVAVQKYYSGAVKTIVLNGITRRQCDEFHLAYGGYEDWEKFLITHGINGEDIVLTKPSRHTGEESRNFLDLAKTWNWERIIISSYPHHQLRCFLQIISAMNELRFWPDVYNSTFHGISWNDYLIKPVMRDQTHHSSDVVGTFPEHVIAEFTRIVKYAQEPGTDADDNKKFTRNATIPEMLHYLQNRGS